MNRTHLDGSAALGVSQELAPQDRAKRLRLGVDGSCALRKSEIRAAALERKRKAIALHVRSGMGKREFVRACGYKWETGREYLDPDCPKKCPRQRFVRLARNVVDRVEIMAEPLSESEAIVA